MQVGSRRELHPSLSPSADDGMRFCWASSFLFEDDSYCTIVNGVNHSQV